MMLASFSLTQPEHPGPVGTVQHRRLQRRVGLLETRQVVAKPTSQVRPRGGRVVLLREQAGNGRHTARLGGLCGRSGLRIAGVLS